LSRVGWKREERGHLGGAEAQRAELGPKGPGEKPGHLREQFFFLATKKERKEKKTTEVEQVRSARTSTVSPLLFPYFSRKALTPRSSV
jgi:hypothetical protein